MFPIMPTKPKRQHISKSVRFAVFARDQFKCRYCGQSSSISPLVIDHIIPVKEGGSSEYDNLISACEPCNQGKSAHMLPMGLSDEDRAKIAQERADLMALAKQARAAVRAKKRLRQTLVNHWCDTFGREEMKKNAATMLVNFAEIHGVEEVMDWVGIAERMIGSKKDNDIARYVCGIRKRKIEKGELT